METTNWQFAWQRDGTLNWDFETTERSGRMRIQAANTPDQVNAWIQRCVLNRGMKELGFDLEYKPSFIRGSGQRKTSLLQIAAGDDVLLIQMFHLKPREVPSLLRKILSDISIRKAGVGIGGDVDKFHADWNVRTEGAVDLAVELMRRKIAQQGLSLAKVVDSVLGIDMCKRKRVTMSNWELRHLSTPQTLYAALDAWVGRPAHALLAKPRILRARHNLITT